MLLATRPFALGLLAAALGIAAPSLAGDPPAKTGPAVAVYDEKADAHLDIARALERAKRNNTRVLVQWGANWCGWCKLLHKLATDDPAVRKELLYEYEVVHVDVGRFDKHLDLAEKYGADLKKSGLPFLTILAADGSVVANQETGSLENAAKGDNPGHDPAKVMAFLSKHQATAPKAADVVAAAMEQAKKEDKRVLDQHAKGKSGGIPWFEFLAPDGTVLATSTAEGGNIGFPAKPEEIAWFVGMLKASPRHLTADDIAALEKSLQPAPAR